jgi:hypothetical protein
MLRAPAEKKKSEILANSRKSGDTNYRFKELRSPVWMSYITETFLKIEDLKNRFRRPERIVLISFLYRCEREAPKGETRCPTKQGFLQILC